MGQSRGDGGAKRTVRDEFPAAGLRAARAGEVACVLNSALEKPEEGLGIKRANLSAPRIGRTVSLKGPAMADYPAPIRVPIRKPLGASSSSTRRAFISGIFVAILW